MKEGRTPMATKTSPIGIIDSGIGGFSVARKVQQQLPHENLLYFGDAGNNPYGNHSAEEISTCFTHSTRCYPDLIGKTAPDKVVVSHGCPDLANLIERSMGDPAGQPAIDADIQTNLEELVKEEKVDCCVLGCTHYPLVEENIHRLYPGLELVDPADQMTKTIRAYLQENGLVNDQEALGTLDIFTTGSVEEYQKKAEKVGLGPITSVQAYPVMKL